MSKFLMTLTGALVFAGSAFASDPGSDLEKMNQSIDATKQTVASVVDSVKIDLGDRKTQFPEYENALDNLITRVQTSSTEYAASLEKIRDYVQSELQMVYSELGRLEDDYKKNPSDDLKQSIAAKQAAAKEIVAHVAGEVNGAYSKTIYNLLTLDGFLQIPVAKHYRIFSAVGDVAVCSPLWAFVILPGFACTVGSFDENDHFIHGPFLRGQQWKETDSFGNKQNATGDEYAQNFASSASRIYGACQSAACTFFIESDFDTWVSKALTLNPNIELMPGITLKKIPTAKLKGIKDALHRGAQQVASGQNTSPQ